jgi:hypothetical protein
MCKWTRCAVSEAIAHVQCKHNCRPRNSLSSAHSSMPQHILRTLYKLQYYVLRMYIVACCCYSAGPRSPHQFNDMFRYLNYLLRTYPRYLPRKVLHTAILSGLRSTRSLKASPKRQATHRLRRPTHKPKYPYRLAGPCFSVHRWTLRDSTYGDPPTLETVVTD